MALTKCGECGREVSDKAAACIGCGAPVMTAPDVAARSYVPPPDPPGMSLALKLTILVVGLVVVFFAFGIKASNTPEGRAKAQARHVIETCWDEQERKSVDPAAQRAIASVCETKESEFVRKYGVRP